MAENAPARPTRTLPVKIGGRIYQLTSDDRYLRYVAAGFEPETVRLLASLADKADCVFDVGANIGCTTLLFSDLARVVYAFEPSPSTFTFLQRNIGENNCHNVILNNIGLGERDQASTIAFPANNRSGGFVAAQIDPGEGLVREDVELRSCDSYVATRSPGKVDLVKIDVEGFEGHVLRGGRLMLEASRPTVTLELNHWCLNAYQRTSVPDFLDLLRSLFPHLYAVDLDTRCRADLHNARLSYRVMYEHILKSKWKSVVGAFDPLRLARFFEAYRSV